DDGVDECRDRLAGGLEVQEMQDAAQDDAGGPGEVDQPVQVGIAQDRLRVTRVADQGDYAGALGEQRLGVPDDQEVVIEVGDLGVRGYALGDLVGVDHGGQPRADVDELPDARVRHIAHRAVQELPVLPGHLRRERVYHQHVLRQLAIGR